MTLGNRVQAIIVRITLSALNVRIPSQPHPAFDRRPAIPSLTGIRIFPAMAVFFLHFGAAFAERLGMPPMVCRLLRNGYMGVSVFFVLSGFIMTYTYEGLLQSKREWTDFAWARFSRIYPVYLLVLLLTLPVLEKPLGVGSAAKVLLMVQAWTPASSLFGFSWAGQAWTLSVEFFFYLAFPILLDATRNLQSKWWAAMLVPISLFIIYFGVPTIAPGSAAPVLADKMAWVPLPLFRFSEFVYGFLLCKCLLSYREKVSAISGRIWINANILLILSVLCTQSGPQTMGCVTLLMGLLFLQLANGVSWVARLLAKPAMVLLGGASYSLYLLQGPVDGWVHWLAPESLARPFLFLLTFLGSIIVYKFYEEPARRRMRDFWKRSSKVTTG